MLGQNIQVVRKSDVKVCQDLENNAVGGSCTCTQKLCTISIRKLRWELYK